MNRMTTMSPSFDFLMKIDPCARRRCCREPLGAAWCVVGRARNLMVVGAECVVVGRASRRRRRVYSSTFNGHTYVILNLSRWFLVSIRLRHRDLTASLV